MIWLPAFRMLSRGRATAPRGGGARILVWRQRQFKPCCLPNGHLLRACDLFEACWMCTRRNGGYEVTAPTCRVGAMLASLIEDVTRGPCASSSGCSMRVASCSTLRGEPGSIRPTLPKLGLPFGSFAKISKTCLSMTDFDDRCSMVVGDRLSMVGDRSIDRSMMAESSIFGDRRSFPNVDGRWSRIDTYG